MPTILCPHRCQCVAQKISLSADVGNFNVSGGPPKKESWWRCCSCELNYKAGQPLRSIDEKSSVFYALSLGEEHSVLEELINTKSCAHLVALVRLNL